MTNMKICLYPYTEQSGIGTYILELKKVFKDPIIIKPAKLSFLGKIPPLIYFNYYFINKRLEKKVNKVNPDLFFSSDLIPFTDIKCKKIEVAWDYPKSIIECFRLAKKYSPWYLLPYFFLREIEFSLLNKISLKKNDKIIAINKKIENRLKKNRLDVVYIPPGINIKKNKEEKYDKFTIVFIARNHIWTKRKGLRYLLDALLLINKDFELIVIGKVPFYSKFKYRRYRKIKDKIRLTGLLPRKETLNILSKAHLLAAPSLFDEFGFVVLEALSLGIPVIASDNYAFTEILTGKCGVITNITDKKKFSEDLLKLIDKKLLNKMSKEAVKRVKENYSWDVLIPRLKKIIKNI